MIACARLRFAYDCLCAVDVCLLLHMRTFASDCLCADSQETPLYRTMNGLMSCDRDPDKLKPFMPYMKLLTTALYSLPPQSLTVYRCIYRQKEDSKSKKPLIDSYKQGDTKTWCVCFFFFSKSRSNMIGLYWCFSLLIFICF
jgi:hypothetical protein